jgi:hypothetical protein
MAPPAGLLPKMIGCPSNFSAFAASVLPAISTAVPAPNAHKILIGLFGYSCACESVGSNMRSTSPKIIDLLSLHCSVFTESPLLAGLTSPPPGAKPPPASGYPALSPSRELCSLVWNRCFHEVHRFVFIKLSTLPHLCGRSLNHLKHDAAKTIGIKVRKTAAVGSPHLLGDFQTELGSLFLAFT